MWRHVGYARGRRAGTVLIMTTTAPAAPATAPFGRMLTAMITPMTRDGAVDYAGAARLAAYLVDDMRNDGLVVSGTTGESPVTTDEEKERLLRSVVEAVGDRASVVAGVGTNDTAHTLELARQAEQAGADGLLVVTPYYSKPPQHALAAHFTAVAGATSLPVLLYDIPGRTGTPIATDTLVRLAEHPRIVAVKDAKDDAGATSEVMARTDLVYYCGTDMLNLPWLSLGAVGFVSVVGHVVGDRLHDMIDAFEAGQTGIARELHLGLLPVYTGMFRNQGVVMTKAALAMLGLPGGPVRAPLADASAAEIQQLREDLERGGLKLPGMAV
jgi:4-hydroxy-tetrahydrodipicolinate synthase